MKSIEGKGAVFTITDLRDSETTVNKGDTRKKSDILVVDDDVSHCTILQALLRGWGYNVALAYSGHDALAQVREKVF